MILKSKLLKVLFWLFSLFIAFTSCVSFVVLIYSYTESLSPPSAFALVGGFLFSAFVSIFFGLVHIVIFMILLFQIFNSNLFNLKLLIWLPSRGQWYIHGIRTFGYLFASIFLYHLLNSIYRNNAFVLWESIFYFSSICTIIIYIIWLCSWFSKEQI